MKVKEKQQIGGEDLVMKIITESSKSHLLDEGNKLFFEKEKEKLVKLSQQSLEDILGCLLKLNELENKVLEKILKSVKGKELINGLNKIIREAERKIIEVEEEQEKKLNEESLYF